MLKVSRIIKIIVDINVCIQGEIDIVTDTETTGTLVVPKPPRERNLFKFAFLNYQSGSD